MIKKILLRIYQYYRRLSQNYLYWKDMRSLIAEIKPQHQLPDLPEGKYLILIPHSDDEWIGNSTLMSNAKYQVELFDMDMSGNDSPSLHKERFAEMKAMANRFGRILHSKKDGECLRKVIESYCPDFVTVPYFFDWHPEHRRVMEELKNLKTKEYDFNVAMYQVTVPIMSCNITHRNILTYQMSKKKWNLFRNIYHTQSFFPIYRVHCHERINGRLTGVYACEAFCVMNYRTWRLSYNTMIPREDEIIEIKANLGSIRDIRECRQHSI